MHLHEWQAKILLEKAGIKVPPYSIAANDEEIQAALEKLKGNEAVVKVQIHAGGRGKAGGVKFGRSKDEIGKYAKELLGKKIVNNQTGPAGLISEKILITEPVKIKKEYYVAAAIDRAQAASFIIASQEGGTEIEETAHKKKGAILKEKIGLDGSLKGFQLIYLTKKMGWEGSLQKQGMELFSRLAKLAHDIDATLIEINPLVVTEEGELVALDAKCTVDDNALFRHPDIEHFYDPSQHTTNEVLAKDFDLSFVGLDGNIGCMVNGAGLAMATMDILYYYGGSPANFLDVGGGATLEKITQGFKILLRDPKVKSIFVNIFGGIMDCSLVAEGIVRATNEEQSKLPTILRLEGTNVEKGKQILTDAKLPFFMAKTMAEGAQEAVKYGLNQ